VVISNTNTLSVGGISTLTGNISLNGSITSNIIPDSNGTRLLGNAGNRWVGNFTTINASGNVTIGDSVSDDLFITSRVATSIVPKTNNAVNLGDPSLRWANINGVNLSVSGTSSFGGFAAFQAISTGNISSSGTVTAVNLTATGTLSLNQVSSSIIPTVNYGQNLGSLSVKWANLFIAQVHADGNIRANLSNTSGQGFILSDDGDFVDNNDAFGTMRFTNGIRITQGKNNNTPAINLWNTGLVEANVVTASTFTAAISINAGFSLTAVNGYFQGRINNLFGQGMVLGWNVNSTGISEYFNNRGGGGGGHRFWNSNGPNGNPSDIGQYTEVAYHGPDGKYGQRGETPIGWKTFSGSIGNGNFVNISVPGTIHSYSGVYISALGNVIPMEHEVNGANLNVPHFEAAPSLANTFEVQNNGTIRDWRVIVFYT